MGKTFEDYLSDTNKWNVHLIAYRVHKDASVSGNHGADIEIPWRIAASTATLWDDQRQQWTYYIVDMDE